jgi:hypothetical protein
MIVPGAILTIHDTGIGIPEQDQPTLFTRFFRASNAVSRSIPCTGLGLTIVRTIVENHSGSVALTSKEGAGTTVTIQIPVREDAARGDGPGQPGTRPPWAGYRAVSSGDVRRLVGPARALSPGDRD